MDTSLTFTGERFVPGVGGEIVYEHVHRYAFALRYAAGRRVLDVACGEGYGSALLAGAAREVVGVDIDAPTIAHARAAYAAVANLRFAEGSATRLPLADASVDLVVSFETLEHLDASDQGPMLAEVARVLAPDGVLVLSAPNRREYSEARAYANPYHRHEHDRAELSRLLDTAFPAREWYAQRVWLGSTLWREAGGEGAEAWNGDAARVAPAAAPEPMYFVVVAARVPTALPAPAPALSLFSDAGETEWKRAARQAAEALRLDALAREREALVVERDRQLAGAHAHVRHLEALNARLEPLVTERERLVVERDRQLTEAHAHVRHLEELCAFRERIVVERDQALAGRDAEIAARGERIAAVEREAARVPGLASDLAAADHRLGELAAECGRLDRALAAQERIIAYRQSVRWWFVLPWMRAKLAWARIAGRLPGADPR
ncbi:MAG: methyltransferase domain-containing protein [Burkholderiales bacterium]|nr:methyltransferase domain-containing protein [Burkholderiales bacterium]